MVLTIWDLIKAVYKHKFAIIAVTLAAFVCSYLYIDRHQSYTAQTVVEYKDACIKEGKSLDGETFDVYEMISPSVISDVIDDLSLNHSVESIRSQITIEPIVPDSQAVIKEATEEEGEEYTYYPTSYVVSFEATTAFTYAEARDILDSLIQNYLTYYTEKYLNLATLQEIDYGMENADYDYIEKAEILRDNINATVDTLSSYSNASSSFRSTSTGYTFNDIS
ncbi:MAG: hypothetical protein LUD03_03255 [Firmicutes bacterium]|nr:hypothetical protein [Bacillota bacterium]